MLLCPWDSPGMNMAGGCHALLQEIFPTQDRIASLLSPALTGRFFITEPPGTPTRGCYLAIKKNEIMPFAETRMNLETVTVNGVSHKKTDIMIPLITGITK